MEAQLKKDYERSDFSEFGGYYLLVSLFDAEKDNIEWMSWHILYYCINVYDVKELDGRKVFVCIYEQWDTDNHAFIGDCKKGRYLFPILRTEARYRLEEIQKYMDSWKYPMTIRDIDIPHSWNGEDSDGEVISFRIYDKSKSKIYRLFQTIWNKFYKTHTYSKIKELLIKLGLKKESWLYFD